MIKKIPIGITVTRAINLVNVVLNVIVVIAILGLVIYPRFNLVVEHTGGISKAIPLIIIGLILFVIFCIPAILLIILNRALWHLKKQARIWQIVISCIFLLAFPIGTILNCIILYFILVDKNTKEAFGIPKQIG